LTTADARSNLNPGDVVVSLFGGRRIPRPLRGLQAVDIQAVDIDDITSYRRVIVVGSDADLASVLTRLLRANRLDIEVGHAPSWWKARRARSGEARRVPLIRDETGTVIVGAAEWTGSPLRGEAVVDDTVLFDGEVTGVRIEPIATLPGLRAAVTGRGRRRWVTGRAAQLGTPGATVVRDGVAAPRPVKRSTFYRHTEGWLRVG
jgi:hypothetical protein